MMARRRGRARLRYRTLASPTAPMPNFSTSTSTSAGVRKAGSVGPSVIGARQARAASKDRRRLLLEPRDDERQRQLIDAAAESFRQFRGDDQCRISVVALTHVQEPRQPADRAVVVLLKRYLPQPSVRITYPWAPCRRNR